MTMLHRLKNKKINARVVGVLGIILCLVTAATVYAQKNITLNLSISTGNLSVDIRTTADDATVADPSFDFDAVTTDVASQTASGSIPAADEEIYISNLDAADSGWTLTIKPEDGQTAVWKLPDGDDADTDLDDSTLTVNNSSTGLMTVDPSSATFAADCDSCSTANISLGSEANFNSNASVTLVTAAAAADDIGAYTLTGVEIEQTIPGGQGPGEYSLAMEITVTSQ